MISQQIYLFTSAYLLALEKSVVNGKWLTYKLLLLFPIVSNLTYGFLTCKPMGVKR